MRNPAFFWIVLVIMLPLDFYAFQAVRVVTSGLGHRARMVVFSLYWTLSVVAVLMLLALPFFRFESWPRPVRTYLFTIILGLFFAKLITVIFLFVDDIRRLVQWAAGKVFFRNTEVENLSGSGISRSVFISWLGLGAGTTLLGSLIYGFTNKYNYETRRIRLAFSNLPDAFRGLKIVQISDIHSGSFNNKQAVRRGIDKILEEKPDLILFTGDLVNDRAIEMTHYMDVFNRLSAPMGVYSTLGNHDYGDYFYGHSPAGQMATEKVNNLQRLKEIHGELGWKLMLDEHVALEKDGQQIALIGVQNISGKPSFHSYGDMKKAYAGAEKYPFKILMSHDPSHWRSEVRPHYPDVDLMLSGHTHGMQFGVEIPGLRWSPVEYVYKEWAGIYENGSQKLYVNRGFGFIGYPGRVGILPEITVIELA